MTVARGAGARPAAQPGRRIRFRAVRAGAERPADLAEAASLFGAIVTLSMVTTPFLMMATRRIREEPGPLQGEPRRAAA
jgi:hypothetical protein